MSVSGSPTTTAGKIMTFEPFQTPSVTFISLQSLRRFLIVLTPTSKYYCLIHIDPYYGALSFTGVLGKDMFITEKEAIDFISKDDPVENLAKGFSILGYTTSGKNGILILIKSVQAEYKLMTKNTIFKIKDVEIITFDIMFQTSFLIDIEKLKNYPFNYNHYFCQTFDIASPFSKSVTKIPAVNAALVVALRNTGVPDICPYVIQGNISVARIEEYVTDALFIMRRVAVNTHIEQGMDKNAKPSIEYQVEIAFISVVGNGYRILSHVMHIGSIPLLADTISPHAYSLISQNSGMSTSFSGGSLKDNGEFDDAADKQNAKVMFEKIVGFTPCNERVNVIVIKNHNNPIIMRLFNRVSNVSTFTEPEFASSMLKTNWSKAGNSKESMDSAFELFLSTVSPKLKVFGYSETLYSKTEKRVMSMNLFSGEFAKPQSCATFMNKANIEKISS